MYVIEVTGSIKSGVSRLFCLLVYYTSGSGRDHYEWKGRRDCWFQWKRTENVFPQADEKGAIGGHAFKTEMTLTPPQGETGAIINGLISAMTHVFKQSSDKPSPYDSTSRNVALKQPKLCSLGQNVKVWLSHFDEYSKLANIPKSKRKTSLVTLLDQTAYRAVQLPRIPESAPYQDF